MVTNIITLNNYIDAMYYDNMKYKLRFSFLMCCHCVQVISVIRDDILPYNKSVPREFVVKVMNILNKGSIHSAASTSFVGEYTGTLGFRFG